MILRAALAFGLVWLLMGHGPDLGMVPAKAACAACELPGSSALHARTLARLAEVKIELNQAGRHNVMVAGAGEAVREISGRLAAAVITTAAASALPSSERRAP